MDTAACVGVLLQYQGILFSLFFLWQYLLVPGVNFLTLMQVA
jgi:hypothetical protein